MSVQEKLCKRLVRESSSLFAPVTTILPEAKIRAVVLGPVMNTHDVTAATYLLPRAQISNVRFS
jgi:hypothetical protein